MDTVEKARQAATGGYQPVPGITSFIVADVRALLAAPLPADVVEAARQSVLDWFGIAIGGADEPLVAMLRDQAREQGGHAQAEVVFHGETVVKAQLIGQREFAPKPVVALLRGEGGLVPNVGEVAKFHNEPC